MDQHDRRRPSSPFAISGGWLSLNDDDLLYQIESLGEGSHDKDDAYLERLRSERRHLEVRKAADAQLRHIAGTLKKI
jgi:hypothetical protein